MKVGTKLFLMFLGTALIIIIVGATSFASVLNLIQSNKSVRHSKDVLQELNLLNFNLADCVSAQRGYIISGKQPFLEAYQAQVRATNESSDRIIKLVADNPEQLKRAKLLRETLKERLGSLEITCNLYKAKGSEAAFERIRNGKSLQYRYALQKQIEEIEQREEELLEQRDAEAQRDGSSADMTVWVGMLLALTFLAASNFLFGSTIVNCIKQLITASENITYGRFDLSAQTNTSDEFADLAAAFNSMGQQLLLASKNLKEKVKESEEQQTELAQVHTVTENLKTRLESISQLSDAEATGLANYKERLDEFDQWLSKLQEMSFSFQDQQRTSQEYVQRVTYFNEGASKTVGSLQSQLEPGSAVDHIALSRDFNLRITGVADITQTIDKLIAGLELITMTAEIEQARTQTPDKSLNVLISSLKEKALEAKATREDAQKHLAEMKAAAAEVLERYKDVTSRLTDSRQNATRLAADLDKQTELCHELRVLFADSLLQKYVAFISSKRAFSQDLKEDALNRGLLASQLSEIASSDLTNPVLRK